MNIKKIPVDLVDVEDRLRPVNGDYVAEIAQSFEEKGGEGRGQITPIEVREAGETGRFRLISGAHRLAAARQSGWKAIAASVIRCTNDEARLREIDENLIRNDLSSLDRAAFMIEREAVWVQMHPDNHIERRALERKHTCRGGRGCRTDRRVLGGHIGQHAWLGGQQQRRLHQHFEYWPLIRDFSRNGGRGHQADDQRRHGPDATCTGTARSVPAHADAD
jgi:uncharacterized ParB-like nuclease family protein